MLKTETTPRIRILIADDHAILREGLRALLGYYDDIEVVGEAEDGAQAIDLVSEIKPDLVLMDIAMPGTNGIDATRAIREKYPHTRVLILTQHEDRQYVLPLLNAGAVGYVSKRALGNDLINAIHVVMRGETFLYPSAATAVVDEIRHHGATAGSAVDAITPREMEILQHIVGGETNIETAAALSISVKTVEWHRANLMSKLDAHSAADLVRYALQNGLVVTAN